MVGEGREGVEGGHGMDRGWRHFCGYRLKVEESLERSQFNLVSTRRCMCETRDGGWVVDGDEAPRKFGRGRKAEVPAERLPRNGQARAPVLEP